MPNPDGFVLFDDPPVRRARPRIRPAKLFAGLFRPAANMAPQPAEPAVDWLALQMAQYEQMLQRKRDLQAMEDAKVKEYKRPEKMFSPTRTPFYMPYDNLDEIKMRLEGSIIRLDGMPIYVTTVRANRLDPLKFEVHFRRDYTVDVTEKVIYEPGCGIDLAPFNKQYIQRKDMAAWVFRKPVRGVYKQGACPKNTFYAYAGSQDQNYASTSELMTLYRDGTPVRRFIEVAGMMKPGGRTSFALSSHVAVISFADKAVVEYKSIEIGEIPRGQKLNFEQTYGMKSTNSDMTNNPWCTRCLDEVGIYVNG